MDPIITSIQLILISLFWGAMLLVAIRLIAGIRIGYGKAYLTGVLTLACDATIIVAFVKWINQSDPALSVALIVLALALALVFASQALIIVWRHHVPRGKSCWISFVALVCMGLLAGGWFWESL